MPKSIYAKIYSQEDSSGIQISIIKFTMAPKYNTIIYICVCIYPKQ